MVEALLTDAVKDGHLSLLVMLLGALWYQIRENNKSVDGLIDSVKTVAEKVQVVHDDNISQEEAITNLEDNVKEIKEGVVWRGEFVEYKEGHEKRTERIEKYLNGKLKAVGNG